MVNLKIFSFELGSKLVKLVRKCKYHAKFKTKIIKIKDYEDYKNVTFNDCQNVTLTKNFVQLCF